MVQLIPPGIIECNISYPTGIRLQEQRFHFSLSFFLVYFSEFTGIFIVSAVLWYWASKRSTVRKITTGGETQPGSARFGPDDF